MNSINIKLRVRKIDYYYAIYFLIVLPFLFPAYFSESGSFKIVEFIVTYLSLGLMIVEIVRDRGKQINYFPFLVLTIEYIVLIYSTIINEGELGTTINTTIKKLLLCYIVGKVILNDRKTDSFLRAVRDICVAIFFINLVSELLYPMGIPSTTTSAATPHYFLGNVNSVIRAVFPGLCCAILINEKRNKKLSISLIFFYIGFLYQFIYLYHSATTIVALIIILAWIFFSEFIKKHLWTIYAAVIGIITYIQINLVVMSSSPRLLNFLSTVFGKNVTFSGRLYIWERTLIQIYRNPIWGYGIQKSDTLNSIIGNQFSAHNYFLDIVYQRGLIGLIIFLVLLAAPLFLLRKKSNVTMASYYLVGFQCSIMFMYLFEPFYSSEARMLPILCSMLLLLIREKQMPSGDINLSR